MSALTDTLKKQLDEARGAAQEGWQAFSEYRKSNGDEKIAKDKDLFEEANRLHGVYGEAAETAKDIEARLFAALKMDGEGPEGIKGSGSGDIDVKDMTGVLGQMGATKAMKNLAERAAEAIEKSASYEAYIKSASMKSDAAQSGSLFQVADAIKRAELKTLLTGALEGQGVFLLPDLQPGVYQNWVRIANVMTGLITVGETDNDTVDWVSYDGYTMNAAETPEAVDGDKAAGAAASTAPESALSFSRKSTPVEEIKHFIPATKRQLADIGQLRTLVDQELLWGLQSRTDNQILNGDGVAPNIKGILNTAGIQTQARGTDPQIEAIHKAFTKLVLAGYTDLGCVLNANDWQTIRLSKDATGNYLFGPPSISGGMQVWGYPVTLSQHIAAGTGLAADFRRSCTMWLREGASLAATDTHSDWFLKGIVAVLATMRAAFGVVRPLGVCTVTGL